jgi:hypothetical protein
VLYSFKSGKDGANPNGGLVLDRKGAIYGTTFLGGGSSNCQTSFGTGCGTVFQLKPARMGGAWTENILHRFEGGTNDSARPNGSLIWDSSGSLYGTTWGGQGSDNDGAIFKLSRPNTQRKVWKEDLLHVFNGCGGQFECRPSGLIFDQLGHLYGLTGLILQIRPPEYKAARWTLSLVYKFKGSPDGYDPVGMTFDKAGSMYGTTLYGGIGQACQGGCGTVFEVSH